MKAIARFILDLLGLIITLGGFVSVAYGFVIIKRGHYLYATAIIIGGIIIMLTGAFISYISAPKDKRRFSFEGKLVDNIITILLPPW